MCPGLLAAGHHRPDPIAGLKALHLLLPHQIAPWEAVLVEARALITAAPHGLDDLGGCPPAFQGVELADTGGIQGMGLGNAQPLTAVLGATTTAHGDRQASGFHGAKQRPARGVDSSGVPQW
ncbi:hypothetical protein VRRI112168_20580 [Vreelandella rituensis]